MTKCKSIVNNFYHPISIKLAFDHWMQIIGISIKTRGAKASIFANQILTFKYSILYLNIEKYPDFYPLKIELISNFATSKK